jgi:Tfp pilus assembly protein PilF
MKPLAAGRRRRRLAPVFAGAILILVALGLRLAYIQDIRDTADFAFPLVDAFVYDRSAREIAHEGPQALAVPYYQPPGYPLLLGAVYAATEGDYVSPRVLNAILGTATVLLIFFLGRRLSGELAGWVAALLFATYGPVLYFEGQLLPPALLLFLTTTALAACLAAERSSTPARWLGGAGLLLGLATVTRPTVLLLAAGLAWWWSRGGRGPEAAPESRRRAGWVAFGAFLAALLPVTAANVLGGRQPVLVSWNGGINFYLGNGSGSDSLTEIQPGASWDRLQREPLFAGARGGAAQSRYWVRLAVSEALEEPGEWALALGRKAIRFLDAREAPRNSDYDAFRPSSTILSLPLPGFALVAPLALLGILSGGLARRARAALLIALGTVAAENLLFFVTSRYRLEAVPVLCLLAGCGVAAIVRSGWRRLDRRVAAVVLLFAAFVIVDVLGERHVDYGRAALNRGVALRRAGKDPSAARAFREALRHSPGDPDAHRWLGEMALGEAKQARSDSVRVGKAREAIDHFNRSLAAAPDYVRVLLGKAQALEQAGRREEAEPVYRAALAADPFSTEVRLNYGVYLALAGRTEEARWMFSEGLRLAPNDSRLRANLRRLDRGL